MKLTPMGVISPSLAKEIKKATRVIFKMLQNIKSVKQGRACYYYVP
jgi:hypothetical protein